MSLTEVILLVFNCFLLFGLFFVERDTAKSLKSLQFLNNQQHGSTLDRVKTVETSQVSIREAHMQFANEMMKLKLRQEKLYNMVTKNKVKMKVSEAKQHAMQGKLI